MHRFPDEIYQLGRRDEREAHEAEITTLLAVIAAADRVAEAWKVTTLDAGIGIGEVWAAYDQAREKINGLYT